MSVPEPPAATRGSRGSRWRWWHVALLVAAVPLVLTALWAALIVVTISGGVDDLFSGDPPTDDDPQVVAAHDTAATTLPGHAADVTVTVTAVLGAAQPIGGGQVDLPCQVGQHNWKIDDDFDLACDLTQVTLVAVPDQRTLAADMAAVEAALAEAGWVPTAGPTMADARDRLPTHLRTDPGTSGTVDPDARAPRPELVDPQSTGSLPAVGYTRTRAGTTHHLRLDWAQPGSLGSAVTVYDDHATLTSADGTPTTPEGLLAEIPSAGYALVLTDTVEYFRD